MILQKKPPRENDLKQISSSSSGSLSPTAAVQSLKHEWKIVASEKTSSKHFVSFVDHLYYANVNCKCNGRKNSSIS